MTDEMKTKIYIKVEIQKKVDETFGTVVEIFSDGSFDIQENLTVIELTDVINRLNQLKTELVNDHTGDKLKDVKPNKFKVIK